MGTVAVDLLLAVVITSLLRHRVGLGAWRAMHLLVWPAWLLGVGHALALGTTSARTPWAVLPVCACLVAVAWAGATRLAALGRTASVEPDRVGVLR